MTGSLGALDAFRQVFGENPSPDSIAAAAAEPRDAAEALLAVWDSFSLQASDLPPLAGGELRPLVIQRGPLVFRQNFSWAEYELDHISCVLSYAHSIVLSDPFSDFAPALEEGTLTTAQVVASLHVVAFLAPLLEAGVVRLLPRQNLRPGVSYRGPWGSVSLSSYRLSRAVGWIEDRLGLFENASKNEKLSSSIAEKEFGWSVAAELIAQTNAVNGRAQLLDDYPAYWRPEGSYREKDFFRSILKQGWRQRLQSGQLNGEDQKLLRLVQQPLPDLAIVTAQDLITVRQSDGLTSIRNAVGLALEQYEVGIAAGRHDVGEGIADEFRAASEKLEAEIRQSSALSALRRGASTFGVTGAAGLASAPLLGALPPEKIAVPAAAAGLIEYARALIVTARESDRRRAALAHATVARGVAERFDLL
jgi:hypothetical protein